MCVYAGLPQGSPSQLSSGPSLNRDAYVRTNGAGNAINFAEVCGTSISGEGYALSKCLSFLYMYESEEPAILSVSKILPEVT